MSPVMKSENQDMTYVPTGGQGWDCGPIGKQDMVGIPLMEDTMSAKGRVYFARLCLYANPTPWSVLGKLFRAVELPPRNPARETVDAPRVPVAIQKRLAQLVAVYGSQIKTTFDHATGWVQALLLRYIAELNHICVSHTVSSETSERVSEVEVMLGTNLETASEGSNLIERMKRLTGDLTDFVRSELQGDENDSPYDWLARAWKAYIHTSSLGDENFGALSFSWIALGSVLDALHKIDDKFLPDLGPIIPPIPTPTTTRPEDQADLDKFAEVDFVNWVWDDSPKPNKAGETDGDTQCE